MSNAEIVGGKRMTTLKDKRKVRFYRGGFEMTNKLEIFKLAHLKEGNNLAREYFSQCGLSFEILTDEHLKKLIDFVDKEILELALDESYSLLKEYRMNQHIKKDKYGYFLTCKASYFDNREAISFYNPKNNDNTFLIGFCGWASGCNNTPIIKGFIKWCDYIKHFFNITEEDLK